MRKIMLGISLLAFGYAGLAQNDCSTWLKLNAGAELVYAWYDEDGEITDYSQRLIKEVAQRGEDGLMVLIGLSAWSSRGDTLFSLSYLNQCKDGEFWVSTLSRLTPRMLSSVAHLDVEISGSAMVLPDELTASKVIDNNQSVLYATQDGQPFLEIDLSFENIVILTTEVITTPAGSFDCHILQYETAAATLTKKKLFVKEWYAAGIGIIRQEIFDEKRKLINYQELIALQR